MIAIADQHPHDADHDQQFEQAESCLVAKSGAESPRVLWMHVSHPGPSLPTPVTAWR